MRRRRWAPLAAACLVALVAFLAVAVHGARGAGAPVPAARRSAASGGATVAFDAARVAACKKKKAGAACGAGVPGDDDDLRVVPTGANPLHNR